jgi:predicted nucleic-acid-binding protein
LIAGAVQRDEPIFISDIVMCETVWVLSTSYRFSRSEITGALSDLIRGRGVVFSSGDSLARALRAYHEGKGDFADYLIREHARTAGADTVATFDRALLNDEGFSRP